MEQIEHIDTDKLHHAYIIEQGNDTVASLVTHIRKHISDIELHVRQYDIFGIDESRELDRLARMRSIGTQVFVYSIQSATREAQNALLKLFEEPPERTHFFWCVMSIADVIPTLISRSMVVARDGNSVEPHTDAITFMNATPAERIALLAPIIKEKDITKADALLHDIVHIVHTQKMHEKKPLAVEHIMQVQSVLHDKGVSLKPLLESVALVVPVL